jgi:hypothetical protein
LRGVGNGGGVFGKSHEEYGFTDGDFVAVAKHPIGRRLTVDQHAQLIFRAAKSENCVFLFDQAPWAPERRIDRGTLVRVFS